MSRCNVFGSKSIKFSCRVLAGELGCCERGGSRVLLDDDDAGSLLGGLGGRSVELQERVHLHLEQSPLGLCGGGDWRGLGLAVADERVTL